MLNPRVLIVDNDTSLANTLSGSLQRSGMEPSIAGDGSEALRLAYQTHPDLVILDLMLPRGDGRETCRKLKRIADVPVIATSSRRAEADLLDSFGAGADDYVAKPFSLAEVLARVKALLRRRAARDTHLPKVVRVRDLELDPARHRISRAGQPLDLTPKEHRLLAYLMHNTGRVVAHGELLAHAWGPEYTEAHAYLTYYVRFLRIKLGDSASSPTYIKTLRGRGYQLLDR